MNRQLVLASSSPARRQLLVRLQIPFVTATPDIDESQLDNESIQDMLLRLAQNKAAACKNDYPDAVIIGADTIGLLDGQPLNKPITMEKGIQQLQSVSGKQIRFYTSLCLLDAVSNEVQTAIETYDVFFRELTEDTIKTYLQKENSLHCAGCFHAEGLGITLVEKFAGDDFSTLIGLPLIQLTSMLTKWNLR